jgi:recombinational DNA repair protein RecR
MNRSDYRALDMAPLDAMSEATPCPRCQQVSTLRGVCATCRAIDREPQGEAVRLFTPAPNQLPGQLSF